MLSKLALRNAKRSGRDYAVYLMTIALSMGLVYSFNTLVFSEEIKALSSGLGTLTAIIIFISCIVVFVVGWLIYYMMRFMLERRCKEFGTYMLLGISNKNIIRLFRRENLLMGLAAFLAGILFGTLIYQFLAIIIMNIFGVAYRLKLTFSIEALGLSLLYFSFIYLFAITKTGRKLKKMKIYDLLYAEKKNESESLYSRKNHWLIFILSLVLLLAGTLCLRASCYSDTLLEAGLAGTVLFGGTIMMILSIYGIYMTVPAFLTKAILTNPAIKYRKNILFLTRNLTARLRKTGIALGTLALLITLTLTATQLGVLFKQFWEIKTAQSATFDVGITEEHPSADFEEATSLIDADAGLAGSHTYPIYVTKGSVLYTYFEEKNHMGWITQDAVMTYSDYAQLCKLLNRTPTALADGRYILFTMESMKDHDSIENLPQLQIGGTSLFCQEWSTESFGVGNGLNGTGYVAVVSDELAKELKVYHTAFAAVTQHKTSETLYEQLEELYFDTDYSGITVLYTRTAIENNNMSAFIILSFSLFYVGLIFACVAATILAIQQLSESSKYRFRYDILSKLGVGTTRRKKLVLKNVLFYFAIPLAIPVPLSLFVTACLNHLVLMEEITGAQYWTTVLISLGLFGFLYLLYFAATYIGCRKNV